MIQQYGHWILEGLSRLWYYKQHPDVPLVWVTHDNSPGWCRFHTELLDIAGVANPLHVVSEPSLFSRLTVPEQAMRFPSLYTPTFIKSMSLVEPRPLVPGRKVWVSRSRVPAATVIGGIVNEVDLETVLHENGWVIYHPQEHTIREVLDMLSSAERIAGMEGSAFHPLLLLTKVTCQIDLFPRGEEGLAFAPIGWAKEFEQCFHRTPLTLVRGARRASWYRWDDLSDVASRLGVYI